MNKLKENFEKFLPINRKEKFYTATVLPQIICYENFKYFHLFTKLIDNFNFNLNLMPDIHKNNIQFLTEYSLKESLFTKVSQNKFINPPKTKETPDLLILITEPQLILIVAEAKMYSSSNAYELANQMKQQKKVIDSIKNTFHISTHNIFHFGLVPSKMINKQNFKYPIIYWEEILEAYKNILNDNYFYNVLKLAIENYDTLSSKSSFSSSGQNMETRLNGEEIVNLVKKGENFLVGRAGGLRGKNLIKDKNSGEWSTYSYEVNFSNINPPNVNWFTAKEFVSFLGEKITTSKQVNLERFSFNNNKSDKGIWHFSHLGLDYFLEISTRLGYGATLDVPIELVYIGATGVPYIEKRNGRNVNPNWAVIMKDGRELRAKNYGGNKLTEPGLWDPSNCNIFLWEEIRSYFREITKVKNTE